MKRLEQAQQPNRSCGSHSYTGVGEKNKNQESKREKNSLLKSLFSFLACFFAQPETSQARSSRYTRCCIFILLIFEVK